MGKTGRSDGKAMFARVSVTPTLKTIPYLVLGSGRGATVSLRHKPQGRSNLWLPEANIAALQF